MDSLYEIDRDLKAMLESIFDSADENGEVEVDFSALEELQQKRADKLENIALYIKNLSAEALAIKNEENTLTERRKRIERKCERLERYMKDSILANGEKGFESPRCVVKIKASEATEIVDESLIPEKYIVTKTEFKPDKKAIKEAIKAGEEVAGARIITNYNINIK